MRGLKFTIGTDRVCVNSVAISPECHSVFQQLHQDKKLKYIIYKLSDDMKTIVVEKSGSEAEYSVFEQLLPEQEPRYAVYDFEYDSGEGKRKKICFYSWSPDDAPTRAKMVYASSKSDFRNSLGGSIHAEIQGTDRAEIDYNTVLAKVSKGAAGR
ncbi:hypothetical protein BZA77DRAFT_175525 [Pyronema omphalodes]|nr:hypothetical protein BZA77DRAFT_175525 [Pyronema omphalodes]